MQYERKVLQVFFCKTKQIQKPQRKSKTCFAGKFFLSFNISNVIYGRPLSKLLLIITFSFSIVYLIVESVVLLVGSSTYCRN